MTSNAQAGQELLALLTANAITVAPETDHSSLQASQC